MRATQRGASVPDFDGATPTSPRTIRRGDSATIPNARPPGPDLVNPDTLLALQAAAGNRAVATLPFVSGATTPTLPVQRAWTSGWTPKPKSPEETIASLWDVDEAQVQVRDRTAYVWGQPSALDAGTGDATGAVDATNPAGGEARWVPRDNMTNPYVEDHVRWAGDRVTELEAHFGRDLARQILLSGDRLSDGEWSEILSLVTTGGGTGQLGERLAEPGAFGSPKGDKSDYLLRDDQVVLSAISEDALIGPYVSKVIGSKLPGKIVRCTALTFYRHYDNHCGAGRLKREFLKGAQGAELAVLERAWPKQLAELKRQKLVSGVEEVTKSIHGFQHDGTAYVQLDYGTTSTVIHESMHLLSHEGKALRAALGKEFDEGATEYLARKVAAGRGLTSSAYPTSVVLVSRLIHDYRVFSEAALCGAYFNGEVGPLTAAIADTAGPNFSLTAFVELLNRADGGFEAMAYFDYYVRGGGNTPGEGEPEGQQEEAGGEKELEREPGKTG